MAPKKDRRPPVKANLRKRRPHFLHRSSLQEWIAELLATNWPGAASEESGLPVSSRTCISRMRVCGGEVPYCMLYTLENMSMYVLRATRGL